MLMDKYTSKIDVNTRNLSRRTLMTGSPSPDRIALLSQ